MVCNVKLLIHASSATYGLQGQDTNQPIGAEKNEALAEFSKAGYKLADYRTPQNSGGTAAAPMAALCLEPTSGDNGPIVIAFRGTKKKDDIWSNLNVGAKGVAKKEQRDAAFAFYEEMQKKYPNREIILTGHSLGGNLAQYVAARAYSQADSAGKPMPTLSVRTFNPAPIKTRYSEVFTKRPELTKQIVNYRLSKDVISSDKTPFHASYGDMYVFQSKLGTKKAHDLSSMLQEIPPAVLNRTIGFSKNDQLIEQVNGSFESYQCRVNNQWFPGFRQGAVNLNAFETRKQSLLAALQNHDYGEAKAIIAELRNDTSGSTSTHLLNVLHNNIEDTEKTEKIKPAVSMSPLASSQGQWSDTINHHLPAAVSKNQTLELTPSLDEPSMSPSK